MLFQFLSNHKFSFCLDVIANSTTSHLISSKSHHQSSLLGLIIHVKLLIYAVGVSTELEIVSIAGHPEIASFTLS